MSDFAAEWERCAPWLEAALVHCGGTHDLADVKGCVERGTATFWPGGQAAMITEIVDYPKMRTLNFWLAGGDLAELRDVLRLKAETYARHMGCKYATIVGRAGWARALGYSPIHATCAKEL